MSFYDPLGRVDLPTLRLSAASAGASAASVVGWFSARRRSPLRPSMRELAVSLSLSQAPALALPADGSPPCDPRPCVFLLLSSSATANLAVHTHEYRAFVLRPDPSGGSLVPRSLDVINVGPAFRAQYGSFSPESPLPWMPHRPRGAEEKEGDGRGKRGESLSRQRSAAREQRMLDAVTEGFGVERLEKLVGPAAVEYTSQLEDLYGKMLLKLESLARQVEKSSARVLEQENRNLLMRSKLAGLE
ncbi:hypothetical protein ACMD2_01139 [Ananas comosus]|uniref:Uncharacterized protein n=2 Tax=Ananas comosus TaxID=4615 RepID=A0A199UCV1_ANACO|nr:hypothetical protein ACMD2_01139 [Ananas comosus]CAD1817521.1 unnamed protein product [Ananas comosus var. bracteatus]